jgi:predicted nucleic acid-binding protein
MPFIVDASVAAAWVLPDEDDPQAEAALSLLERDDGLVPDLFWHEVRNTLVVAERRQRITAVDMLPALIRLESLLVTTIRYGDHSTIISLARKHRLTTYDATYLALALTKELPLTTLDTRLQQAALAEKLPAMPT